MGSIVSDQPAMHFLQALPMLLVIAWRTFVGSWRAALVQMRAWEGSSSTSHSCWTPGNTMPQKLAPRCTASRWEMELECSSWCNNYVMATPAWLMEEVLTRTRVLGADTAPEVAE